MRHIRYVCNIHRGNLHLGRTRCIYAGGQSAHDFLAYQLSIGIGKGNLIACDKRTCGFGDNCVGINGCSIPCGLQNKKTLGIGRSCADNLHRKFRNPCGIGAAGGRNNVFACRCAVRHGKLTVCYGDAGRTSAIRLCLYSPCEGFTFHPCHSISFFHCLTGLFGNGSCACDLRSRKHFFDEDAVDNRLPVFLMLSPLYTVELIYLKRIIIGQQNCVFTTGNCNCM